MFKKALFLCTLIVAILSLSIAVSFATTGYYCTAWTGGEESSSALNGVTAKVSQECGGVLSSLFLHDQGYNLIDPYAGRAVQVAMWRDSPDLFPDACLWDGYQTLKKYWVRLTY